MASFSERSSPAPCQNTCRSRSVVEDRPRAEMASPRNGLLWAVVIICIMLSLGVGVYTVYMKLEYDDLQREFAAMQAETMRQITGMKKEYISFMYVLFIQYFQEDNQKRLDEKFAPSPPSTLYKLLPLATPTHYALNLKINLPGYGIKFSDAEQFDTKGDVIIQTTVKADTKFIEMHSLKIELDSAVLVKNGEEITLMMLFNIKLGKVAFSREDGKMIEAGDCQIKILFKGKVWEELSGLYQSHYKERDGKQKVAAVTQMEPTYARWMVPCFDEPNYKATWNITVQHPKGTTALGNGHELSSKLGADDYVTTVFAETPKMSSYLLAIIVSEFKPNRKKANTKKGTEMAIWSRPDAHKRTQFALEVGIRVIEAYEKRFKEDFPLKKNDMVAIPDFSAGAMENWGLITYRETDLLCDEFSTSSEKRRVAKVIAHELAHQWFGNLVTMDWWDDLWLNEGFATFVEYFGEHEYSPDMKAWEHFTLDAQDGAFNSDDTVITHPLHFHIQSETDIQAGFNGLAYEKGASVIQMLFHALGENVFNEGIVTYLRKFKWSNAKHVDLWDTLAEAADEAKTNGVGNGREFNLKEMAEEWTTQLGYPLVNVSKDGNNYVLTQNRYYLSKELNKQYAQDGYDTKWTIPIFYHDGKKKRFVLLNKDALSTIQSTNGFPLVNYESKGYFRTCYGQKGWRELYGRIKDIPAHTRTRMYSDIFASAKFNKSVDYGTALTYSNLIATEQEYLPLAVLIGNVMSIYKMFDGKETREQQKIIRISLQKMLSKRGGIVYDMAKISEWDRNLKTHEKGLANFQLMTLQCKLGHARCKTEYVKEFEKNVVKSCASGIASECVKVPVLFRRDVYCYAVKYGGKKAYDIVWNLFVKEINPQERINLLRALGCIENVKIAENVLTMAVDKKNRDIKMQDIMYVTDSLLANKKYQPLLFKYFIEKYDFIYENLKDSESEMNDLISSGLFIISREQMGEMKAFRAKHDYLKKNKNVDKRFEKNEIRLDWLYKHNTTVVNYFQNTKSGY